MKTCMSSFIFLLFFINLTDWSTTLSMQGFRIRRTIQTGCERTSIGQLFPFQAQFFSITKARLTPSHDWNHRVRRNANSTSNNKNTSNNLGLKKSPPFSRASRALLLLICCVWFFLQRRQAFLQKIQAFGKITPPNKPLQTSIIPADQLTSNPLESSKKNADPERSTQLSIARKPPDDREKILFNGLLYMLEQEKIFKDPASNRAFLANKLHTNQKYLSQAVQKCYGSNLNCLLNAYRVSEAKQLIREKIRKDLQADLAADLYLDAGFKSVTSFYRVFKNVTGLTPRSFALQELKKMTDKNYSTLNKSHQSNSTLT